MLVKHYAKAVCFFFINVNYDGFICFHLYAFRHVDRGDLGHAWMGPGDAKGMAASIVYQEVQPGSA